MNFLVSSTKPFSLRPWPFLLELWSFYRLEYSCFTYGTLPRKLGAPEVFFARAVLLVDSSRHGPFGVRLLGPGV
jgi:hypothetical protein